MSEELSIKTAGNPHSFLPALVAVSRQKKKKKKSKPPFVLTPISQESAQLETNNTLGD